MESFIEIIDFSLAAQDLLLNSKNLIESAKELMVLCVSNIIRNACKICTMHIK